MASTDFLYFAAGTLDAPGAMFTASHNPAGYNGIKLCLAGARPIGRGHRAGRDPAAGHRVPRPPRRPPTPGAARPRRPARARTPTTSALRRPERAPAAAGWSPTRPTGWVAWSSRSSSGRCPSRSTILYAELDGTFPNHPADPIQPENLVDLKAAVLEHGADVGLAFDGDADRVFLVDERAEPVSGSLTTALVASVDARQAPRRHRPLQPHLLQGGPRGHRREGRGGDPDPGRPLLHQGGHGRDRGGLRWRALRPLLLRRELPGRLGHHRCDGGPGAHEHAGRPLSELLAPFRRYADSGEINTEVEDPAAAVEAVAEHVAAEGGASIDRLDGLTVDYGDWWYNLRPSNTEPLLRLNVEARTEEECQRHVAEVLALVHELSG